MSDFFYLLAESTCEDEEQMTSMDIDTAGNLNCFSSHLQEIHESQFQPKAFPEHSRLSMNPITDFEELERFYNSLEF